MTEVMQTYVHLQRKYTESDGVGGRSVQWKTYASVWVQIRWTGNHDVEIADVRKTVSAYEVILWRTDALCVGDRIVSDHACLTVIAIRDLTAQFSTMRILCEDGGNER